MKQSELKAIIKECVTEILKEGVYPPVTLQMNKMGHVHMWRGNVIPTQVSKYNHKVGGKESEVYFQNSQDVDALVDSLTGEERGELMKGYRVVTTNVSDEYFGSDESELTNENNSTTPIGDPTKEEMVNFLRSKSGGEDDEFDIEAAIYWFASDFHGGQTSNLYSALSTSEFSPGPMSNDVTHEGETASMLYDELVAEYAPGHSREEGGDKHETTSDYPEERHEPTEYTGEGEDGSGKLRESGNKPKNIVKTPVRKPETDEWVVKWYVDGKYNEDKTYYTNDKSDAEATYKDMAARASKMNEGVVSGFTKQLQLQLENRYKDAPQKAHNTMMKLREKYGNKLEESIKSLNEEKCRIKGCNGRVVSPSETREGLKGLCKSHVESQTDREKKTGRHQTSVQRSLKSESSDSVNEGFEVTDLKSKDKKGRMKFIDVNGKDYIAVDVSNGSVPKQYVVDISGRKYVIYSINDEGEPVFPAMNVTIKSSDTSSIRENETILLTNLKKKDRMNRPMYSDMHGKIYVDIELGLKEKPFLYATTTSGEPTVPLKNFEIRR